MAQLIERLGGVATLTEVMSAASRSRVRGALDRGEIAQDRRGRYVLRSVAGHLALAHEMSAVLSHESAALHYGWKIKIPPETPMMTVRRQRHLTAADRARVTPHYLDLPAGDVHQGVTTALRTVLDCARHLPWDRALTVADSALRAEDIRLDRLRAAAADLRGPGSRAARRVAAQASYVSANPLESVLRAISLDIQGFAFVPQFRVWDRGLYATVDLGDEGLQVALEAEGYAFHTGRREFRRDCRRYDELVAWGWTVFRFTWEQVMLEPDFVRWCLQSWLDSRRGRQVMPSPAPLAHLS